jgi:hypothetical protein
MAHPRAYDLAEQIQRQYARVLADNRLASRPAVAEFYGNGRLALLLRVLATTPAGYRANDIRYLIGQILWSQGRRQEAYAMWRQMSPSPDSAEATTIAALCKALEQPAPDALAIGAIINEDESRWFGVSGARLRRFGYRFDKY